MTIPPHFDASVLGIMDSVSVWLDAALQALISGDTLQATARPLVHALEAIPEAGHFAIVIAEAGERALQCLAAPSLGADEVDALTSQLQGLLPVKSPQDLPGVMPLSPDSTSEIRLFPIQFTGGPQAALIVTVRTAMEEVGQRQAVIDRFVDQVARLAGFIIEDRRLRSSVQDQQSLTQHLFDLAPDAIIRIDRHGRILEFSGRAREIFGYSNGDILGEPVERLMPEPHAALHAAYIDAYMETKMRKLPDFGRRLEAVRRDGSRFPVEIALSEIEFGGDVQFIGVIRDISNRVAREAQLHEMRAAIAAASQQSALGELSATLGHELGQPLTAIANYMDALELRLKRGGEIEAGPLIELTQKAASQARLGGEIVRRVRRLASGSASERVRGDFHLAVKESAEVFRAAADKQGITLSISQRGEDGFIAFDRVQIYQVVANLLTNAIHAVSGESEKHIHVSSNLTDTAAHIRVSDTGPGVPEDDREQIFESYTTNREGGLGLGLAVVRRLAEANDGTISVTETSGGGATFIFQFPVRSVPGATP